MKQRHLPALFQPAGLMILLVILLSGCARTASTRFYTLSTLPAGEPAAPPIPNPRQYSHRHRTGEPSGLSRSPPDRHPHEPPGTSPGGIRQMGRLPQAGCSPRHCGKPVHADGIGSSVSLSLEKLPADPLSGYHRHQPVGCANGISCRSGGPVDDIRNDGRTPIVTRKSNIRKPTAAAAAYTAVVQAESLALLELSREIAATIADISRP